MMGKRGYQGLVVFLITFQIGYLGAQNYHLKSPSAIFHLPPILREVSGITVTNEDEVVCIQDELGLIFRYNTETKEIVERDSFYLNGDYEGVAAVGRDLYVLRSDGTLLEISSPFTNQMNCQIYSTNIPAVDNEGLCYDEMNNRLLILCKSECFGNGYTSDQRMVFGFDLKEKKLLVDPVLIIDIPTIHKFLEKKFNISGSVNIRFNPSEIAIHPTTGKWYILSADARLLCVYGDGKFETAEMLEEGLFYKAEGICFFDNGDMIISNEGPRKGSATVLLFKTKK